MRAKISWKELMSSVLIIRQEDGFESEMHHFFGILWGSEEKGDQGAKETVAVDNWQSE